MIIEFCDAHRAGVIDLWRACGLTREWNDPDLDIDRKLTDGHPFWVIENGGRVIATLMVGYDGHRGSVNYLAVSPEHRGQGLGRLLMGRAEGYLKARGCPKLNLMVRTSNAEIRGFYQALGYQLDEVVVLSTRLIADP
ncbi:GNAT family acetyltransferase [Litorivicinus lipolyticus]|uniref:GNAT family acetyltransferase n=1 Tax=Litorivicinus lipolyticus TaxID=418701 RepID=UPI003B5C13E1